MAKQVNGNLCVYFEYRKGEDKVPQIIYSGSEDQCNKYIKDYNRQTEELYRCVLLCGSSKQTLARIAELKQKYGTTE